MSKYEVGCAEIRNSDGKKTLRRVILWALALYIAILAGMAGWNKFVAHRHDENHTLVN